MGVIGRAREAGRWIAALRRARRGGAAPQSAPGPGAPPRPAVRRPDDDPALRTRLGRWRAPAEAPVPVSPAPLGPRERAAAMRQLSELQSRLSGPPADRVGEAIAAGSVTVRSLGPQDGHVWELPGMRVFAIVGVQAFTVDDSAG